MDFDRLDALTRREDHYFRVFPEESCEEFHRKVADTAAYYLCPVSGAIRDVDADSVSEFHVITSILCCSPFMSSVPERRGETHPLNEKN